MEFEQVELDRVDDVLKVISSQRLGDLNRVVVAHGDYEIRQMALQKEFVIGLWAKLQYYRSLFWCPEHFEPDNFATILADPNHLFFEIYKFGYLEGIVYVTNVGKLVDVQIHGVLFERTLTDKVPLFKALLRWLFDNYSIERVEAALNKNFHATMRLIEKVGFRFEGIRRKAMVYRGEWSNQHLYSILREEVL